MTGEVGVTELVQGGASTGNTSATNATGGTLPALPTAATAAAAAAAAAIAGLGATAPVEGGAPGKPGASHPLTGLSRQKQVRHCLIIMTVQPPADSVLAPLCTCHCCVLPTMAAHIQTSQEKAPCKCAAVTRARHVTLQLRLWSAIWCGMPPAYPALHLHT